MHYQVLKKIRQLRLIKGLSTQEMSERLSIDVSAYTRLESGKTCTWAKYLPDLLLIFDVDMASFFEDLSQNQKADPAFNLQDKKHTKLATIGNMEKDQKIEFLYQERIKDKDMTIAQLERIIEKLTARHV